VLTFNVPSGGTQGEYEVHNNEAVGYPGKFRVSAWVKCGGSWDGARTVLHSRFWDKDGRELGTVDGPWLTQNVDCSDVYENKWEQLLVDFDSQGKTVDRYSVYIGYPLRNTRGKIQIAGISVQPLTWVPRGNTINMMSSPGMNSAQFTVAGAKSGLDTSGSNGGNARRGQITRWLVYGARNHQRHVSNNGLFNNGQSRCLNGVPGSSFIDEAQRVLPGKNWKEGDTLNIDDNRHTTSGQATWVPYFRSGHAHNGKGGCNGGYGVDFESHFCGHTSWGGRVTMCRPSRSPTSTATGTDACGCVTVRTTASTCGSTTRTS
jgi:hypothetical protein